MPISQLRMQACCMGYAHHCEGTQGCCDHMQDTQIDPTMRQISSSRLMNVPAWCSMAVRDHEDKLCRRIEQGTAALGGTCQAGEGVPVRGQALGGRAELLRHQRRCGARQQPQRHCQVLLLPPRRPRHRRIPSRCRVPAKALLLPC